MITLRINTLGTSNYMEVKILDDHMIEMKIYNDDHDDDVEVTMKVRREDIKHLAMIL